MKSREAPEPTGHMKILPFRRYAAACFMTSLTDGFEVYDQAALLSDLSNLTHHILLCDSAGARDDQ